MAVKAPGASSGGDFSSVDNAEVLITIEELQEIADLKNGGINLANALRQAVYEIDEEEADVRIEIAQMVLLIDKAKSQLAAIQRIGRDCHRDSNRDRGYPAFDRTFEGIAG